MIRTITSIKNAKNSEKLVMITAYDALFASLFDEKVDMILVGDSLNNSFNGQKDTVSIDLSMMIYHTKAVLRGAKNTLTITDMPFGSYLDEKSALKNASKIYQQTGAHAVKLEGGKERAHIIKALTNNSIAVIGHIGLMPQFARSEGGFKIRGKEDEDIKRLIDDARAVEDAGAFCIVVEGLKEEAGKAITEAVNIPTIGIGAGRYMDGQVLVWSDMLGFFEEFKPKFVKRYLNGADLVKKAVEQYASDVKNGKFPDDEFIY
ncbi:MAG: 3-methyl-2-oxobutanoate hydroxymethyltransferase [Campylobacteraceae bacterium]|jgi:3-methyl-2-oxobutanoate hydroxymethyltransferase|nr:3-methyl-2-oxobutanoate hydroxymethyltransferase [Campylobacteraceae bacterium]